ncbi:MAG: lipocalin-like domain-containing protein [Lachnospiraceae bacterium]
MVLSIDGVNYSGVVLKMCIENTTVETMVFTALGDTNQLTIWGSSSIEE